MGTITPMVGNTVTTPDQPNSVLRLLKALDNNDDAEFSAALRDAMPDEPVPADLHANIMATLDEQERGAKRDLWFSSLSLVGAVAEVGLRPWIMVQGWLWFLVPLGVPAITYWHMFGLDAMFHLFAWQLSARKVPDTKGAKQMFLVRMAHLLGLGIAWLAMWGLSHGV